MGHDSPVYVLVYALIYSCPLVDRFCVLVLLLGSRACSGGHERITDEEADPLLPFGAGVGHPAPTYGVPSPDGSARRFSLRSERATAQEH